MKCLNCDNVALITKAGKQSNFCSLKCRSKFNSAATIEKRKNTNLLRYGADNPSKCAEVIDKRAQSNLEKYGVENPFSLKEIQAKQQNTMQKLYNAPFASQVAAFKDKQIDTWNVNYGCHPWADDTVREKRRKTLLEKYGVEHPILSDEILLKIQESCLSRYGNIIASKSAEIIEKIKLTHSLEITKDKSRNTCLTRYGTEHYKTSLIPEKIRDLLDNSSELEILVHRYGIVGLSNVLDVSIDTIRNRIKKFNIQILFKSGIQQEIVEYVKSIGVVDVQVDTRKIIPPKELDLYSENHKVAIEVNGSYWHSELNGKHKGYHLEKLNQCKLKDISLFFIWEHLWKYKKEIVKSRLLNKFGKSKKIYARKCVVKMLTSGEKTEFLNRTHLQGDCKSTVNIGLFYDEKLSCVMTFGKPRFNRKAEWELIRFSNELGISVVGGASRLFRYFVNTFTPKSVISYSDRQYGNGQLYSALGFRFESTSPPSYYYTSDYKIFENRLKYQKHKLIGILATVDDNLTEWENMQANGYDRVWDCGTDVWVWYANLVF